MPWRAMLAAGSSSPAGGARGTRARSAGRETSGTAFPADSALQQRGRAHRGRRRRRSPCRCDRVVAAQGYERPHGQADFRGAQARTSVGEPSGAGRPRRPAPPPQVVALDEAHAPTAVLDGRPADPHPSRPGFRPGARPQALHTPSWKRSFWDEPPIGLLLLPEDDPPVRRTGAHRLAPVPVMLGAPPTRCRSADSRRAWSELAAAFRTSRAVDGPPRAEQDHGHDRHDRPRPPRPPGRPRRARGHRRRRSGREAGPAHRVRRHLHRRHEPRDLPSHLRSRDAGR